ncbi:MAG: VanZ family protein [Ferruginibacter sp.]
MKPLTFKSFIPGIAWFFVVLTLICLPGEDIPQPRGWFEWMNLIQFDKLVHSGIFALLAYLFIRPIARAGYSKEVIWGYILKICFTTCIWGLTTELIQKFFIPTRQFDLVDWAADSIGALIALIFCRWYFIKRIPKNRKPEGSVI